MANHLRSGRPVLDLTVSNPTICGFHYPEAEILAALSNRRALDYTPESKGLHSAREAVAAYYRTRVGFAVGRPPHSIPERIVLTSGTSAEGYSHILRLLCEAGDEVLVPAPSYPLFEFLADLADIHLVSYPLLYDHGWQIDFGALRAALTERSRAIVVVHPNNPTGSFVKAHEAAQLAEICAAREMAIVADEVFLDYGDGDGTAATFAFETAALTFTLSGLSKISLLPQMKLAWIGTSGPDSLVRAAIDRLDIIADTYLSPSAPVQLALPKFLSMRQNVQTQLQQRVAANLVYLDRIFSAASQVARLKREGGWYAVLRVPATISDEDHAIALLKRTSVVAHPGHFFNFAQDGFLVVPASIAPEKEFQEGIRRLHEFFGS